MNRKYRTVNIYNYGVDDINKLLKRNCDELGWEFLGFGSSELVKSWGDNFILNFASFRTTEECPHFEELHEITNII